MEKGVHQLNSDWNLYYHNPSDSCWTLQSYVEVGEINTLEIFFHLHDNLITREAFHLGMFFMMKKGIMPIWEDTHNVKGGCWSYKVGVGQALSVWIEIASKMVAETLTNDLNLINGLTLSPKKGFCIIKIWNNDCSKTNTNLLTKINGLDQSQALYTAFRDKDT
jgi:translation initiation factor 4E